METKTLSILSVVLSATVFGIILYNSVEFVKPGEVRQPHIIDVRYVEGYKVKTDINISRNNITANEKYASADGSVQIVDFNPVDGKPLKCIFEGGDPYKPFCYGVEFSFEYKKEGQ